MAYQAPRPRKPQKAPRRPKLPADSAKKAKQIIQRRTIYLLLLFGVLRPLFFRDPMAGRSAAECGTAVLERLTDVENPLSDP